MPITFPRAVADLADILPIASAAWNILRQDEISGLGSGEGLSHDLGPQLWDADCSTAVMSHDDAYALQARFNALDGSNHAFYLYNPAKPHPRADPEGVVLGASTPTISAINANRKALRIAGLPAEYGLAIGDFFHVDYGTPTRRALIQIVEATTASGAGLTPEFEVRPHLRPGITTTLAVSFAKPAAKVKLRPGTLVIESVSTLHSRLRFSARQTLAAG